MKKLKLRRWVKVVLIVLLLVSISIYSNNEYNKAIDKCTSAGHDYQYCVEGLR